MESEDARRHWLEAIICTASIYVVGPALIQSLTAPKSQRAIGQDNPPYTALASLVNSLSLVLVLGTCLVAITLSLGRIPTTGRAALGALLIPWVYLVARDEFAGFGLRRRMLLYPLICAAIWLLRPRLAYLQTLGYAVGILALISIAMGFVLPDKGVLHLSVGSDISPDKAIFSSGVLVGPLSNGNTLGQLLVMGVAPVLLIKRRRWRLLMLAATLYASVWAASRSCLLATAILVVVALVLRVVPRRAAASVTAVVLVSMVGVMMALPFVTVNPEAYTNRGYVWQVSRQAWETNPWFGLGADFYSRIASTSETFGGSVFHGHNQYMQALVQGGYVLALTMGMALGVCIVAAVRLAGRGISFGAVYLAGFIGACFLEVSFALVDRAFLVPVMVIPFACIALTSDLEVTSSPAEVSGSSDYPHTVPTMRRRTVRPAIKRQPSDVMTVPAPLDRRPVGSDSPGTAVDARSRGTSASGRRVAGRRPSAVRRT